MGISFLVRTALLTITKFYRVVSWISLLFFFFKLSAREKEIKFRKLGYSSFHISSKINLVAS